MGKKKRKSAKKPSRVKKTTLKKRHPSPAKKKLVITIIGGAFLLLLVLFLFYSNFGFNSDLLNSGSSENNPGTQSKRKSLLPSRSPGEEIKAPKTHFEDFAGSESCKECHEKEYNLWINSTHGKAGGEPGNVEIIAKFDGNPLVFKDAVVTPKITPNGEYVFIVEQDNRPTRIIRVDAVVGGGHMYGGGTQSFFTKLPDGTIRFLPFDFIRDENLWFVQLQEGKEWTPVSKEISLNDLAHWTPHRILGTMEGTSNCQNCHGSQILLEYLPEKKRYRTRFRTLKINCEACHGPSKRHNELARLENHEELEDLDMAALATFTKDSSLNVCFQCHSTKDMLQDEYLSGDNQNEYYSLNLPILGSEPYLPDGRIRSFAYQRNHVFSDCYVNGSMTCVDCHDPHTQNYRDIVGNPLEGRFDNGQCTGCHASKARNPELHTFHKPDSTGNLCVG
ncbi:hypothetical protein GWN26_09675, partial [Candidatus Saccharibacteria bacterium]|nr:hypothetical protein [Calditrichia bacterium]NIV72366.1 hypothetical protein [Calditrichia bacterium]NIV99387.1 hypothetical protein [Candidatus Saccharibacteria bacterium]NIW79686.1 hypothetical protein [Calditrichia bacterium]